MKNKNAVLLGKQSAKIRRERDGHDEKYYSELAKKGWEKRKLKVEAKNDNKL